MPELAKHSERRKTVDELKLNIDELEERIAPGGVTGGSASSASASSASASSASSGSGSSGSGKSSKSGKSHHSK